MRAWLQGQTTAVQTLIASGVIVLVLVIAAAGSSSPSPEPDAQPASPRTTHKGVSKKKLAPGFVSRATFHGTWPFTVDSGIVACDDLGRITFTTGGTTYGVNGTAMDAGSPPINPIWKKDRSPGLDHGPRVSVSDIITKGFTLCPK